MADPSVEVAAAGGVRTLTLSDPDRKNAYSVAMKDELLDALEGVEADLDAVRCVVLRGAGDAFCAGGDVDRMAEGLGDPEGAAERVEESLARTNAVIRTLRGLPVPVVARVDGPAAGGGASLAAAADVRLASERASIGFGFRRVGLSVDGGASHTLPRAVGADRAAELALTGRTVDAAEAADLGLFHRVFPTDAFDERADAVVEDLATGPTAALGRIKELMAAGPARSLDDALAAELDAQREAVTTDDHAEGVRAFLDGREPEFEGE